MKWRRMRKAEKEVIMRWVTRRVGNESDWTRHDSTT
jgi:hypothetical protein